MVEVSLDRANLEVITDLKVFFFRVLYDFSLECGDDNIG